jgi:hypothetical protein
VFSSDEVVGVVTSLGSVFLIGVLLATGIVLVAVVVAVTVVAVSGVVVAVVVAKLVVLVAKALLPNDSLLCLAPLPPSFSPLLSLSSSSFNFSLRLFLAELFHRHQHNPSSVEDFFYFIIVIVVGEQTAAANIFSL